MTRHLSDDDSFTWERVASEILSDITDHRPDLLRDFAEATSGRKRVEILLLNKDVMRNLTSRVWNRYDVFSDRKSDASSAEFRNAGNEHFRRKLLDSAAAAYTMAVFKAETDSEAYALALANRSACLLEMGDAKESLEDVEMSLATKRYPTRLKGKILKRKLECFKRLGFRWDQVTDTVEELRRWAAASDAGDMKLKLLEDEWRNNGKGEKNDENVNPTLDGSLRDRVFSADLDVRHSSDEMGRHVVANKDIDVGQLLIEEKAFAHILIPEHNLLYCQRCLKSKPNLIPCVSCADVGYCGVDCRDQAFAEYHSQM